MKLTKLALIVACATSSLSASALDGTQNIIRTQAPVILASPSTPTALGISLKDLTLPSGKAYQTFSFDVKSLLQWTNDRGQSKPIVAWSVSGLPAGLQSTTEGVISGTPTTSFDGQIIITANADSLNASQAYALHIIPEDPLSISLKIVALTEATETVPYSFNATTLVEWVNDVGQPKPTVTWSATGLPAGLTISTSGIVSGTPQVSFNGPITLSATLDGTTVSANYNLKVNADIGDKPSFADTQVLYRFNGNSSKEGAWAVTPTARGSLSYAATSPYASSTQSASFTGSQGFYNAMGPINGSGNYTLGAWIKPSSISGNKTIINQRDADNGAQFSFYVSASTLAFYDGGGAIEFTSAPSVITANEWQHVAITKEGATIRLYRNGVKVAEKVRTAGIHSVSQYNGLAIGFDQRDLVNYFSGNMKDVFVASKLMTDRQIKWLAKSGEGYPTP